MGFIAAQVLFSLDWFLITSRGVIFLVAIKWI